MFNFGKFISVFLFITLAMVVLFAFIAKNAIAEIPTIVDAVLDRDANLVVNGSFEDGHPGQVFGPPVWHGAEDTVYWALVDGGIGAHNPANRGELSAYPDNVEMTPPRWIGSGGYRNYAEWVSQYPPIPGFIAVETGPAGSTAPSHGDYSLYFGNAYMSGVSVPQDLIMITPDGEWIFENTSGERVNPDLVPGSNHSQEVRLTQTVNGLCIGATYRLSFTAFGEFAHPAYIEAFATFNEQVADGFFGLEVTGHDTLYLNIPAGYDKDPFGNPSPFGLNSQYTYTVEFIASAETVGITLINWGHWSGGTYLGGTRWVRPPGDSGRNIYQTTDLLNIVAL